MTLTDATGFAPERTATHRTVLMCRPDHFTVSYRINPWMHPEAPTDTSLAVQQWEKLYAHYLELGFDVQLIDPIDGLPDMVYAANGGFVLDGIAYGAKFQYPERQPEGPAYMEWFAASGLTVAEPVSTNEGEGDFLLVGDTIFAGTGFRSDAASHDELRRIYRREVVTLRLVDPSFYHLDTAFAVLDSDGGPEQRRLPAEGVRRGLARHPAGAFPGRDPRQRRGRRGARPELLQRRQERRDRLAGHRLRAPAPRARLSPARRRPLRAPPRRWRRQVLHPGTAPVTR